MGIEVAFGFVSLLARDQALRMELAERLPCLSLDDLVACATGYGYVFTRQDLLDAFKYSWTMKWLHFENRTP